jgi:uncharacterized membrane protein
MKLTKYDLASIGIIVLLFAISFYMYPGLPDKIPTHWNASGQVDGWSGPTAIFLIPVMVVLIYGLFLALPKISVFKENISQFKHFESMKFAIVLFLTMIYGATVLPIYGYDNFNMTKFILPVVALLFIYVGYIIKDVKRNFFIGIRTPWTLSSDVVWKKTHKVGSKLFMLAGVAMLFSVFLPPNWMIWFILSLVFTVVGYSFGYSYWIWKKLGKN